MKAKLEKKKEDKEMTPPVVASKEEAFGNLDNCPHKSFDGGRCYLGKCRGAMPCISDDSVNFQQKKEEE